VILKASQRGGAAQLAAHLMRLDDNEHVEQHEVRGFVAADLHGALREEQAVSKGTRCKQFLFSVSLNPPEHERVSSQAFENAVARIEQKNGLTDHPRIVVFGLASKEWRAPATIKKKKEVLYGYSIYKRL